MMPGPDTDSRTGRAATALPQVGVSSCLLGQAVRYDGGDKRAPFIAEVLPHFVRLTPVCPEVAIGLGVPREPIRLEGELPAPRAVGVVDKSLDVTESLRAYGRETAARYPDLSGYVFKSKSPSCGLYRVKRFAGGQEARDATGLYAAEIKRAFPLLPVVEESELSDSGGQERFLTAVYAYQRWRELQREGVTVERLASFHASYKLVLLARSREHLTQLGRLVAAAGERTLSDLASRYGELFMQVLSRPATRQRHVDVLLHLLGYLKGQLDSGDKAELLEAIERYRLGLLPRAAPLVLLQHHFRRHPHSYIQQQLYLNQPFLF